ARPTPLRGLWPLRAPSDRCAVIGALRSWDPGPGGARPTPLRGLWPLRAPSDRCAVIGALRSWDPGPGGARPTPLRCLPSGPGPRGAAVRGRV
ncbi:MAG: hypothetical protein AAGD10_19550, partial [Myxococcota bacterium]